MKINEVVVDPYEPKSLSGKLEHLVMSIEADCGQMLAAYRQSGKVLWRGIGSTDLALNINIRPNRLPLEMDLSAHYHLEKAFNVLGLPANRTNSIFCTCDPDTARTWGRQYIIFVKDGWSGTVFESIPHSYFFDEIDQGGILDLTPEELAEQIKHLEPAVVTPQTLPEILRKDYKDILITGSSYYAIRYGTETANQIFNSLNINP